MSDANNSLNPNTAAAATDPWADASAALLPPTPQPLQPLQAPIPGPPPPRRHPMPRPILAPPAAVMLQAVTGWAPRPARAFPKTPMPASGTN